MKRFSNLTGLRFFLAALVVIYHVPQFFQNRGLPYFKDFPVFHKGTEAVYMFFSLSGFLIIRQLYEEKKMFSKINLRNFYIRRILRIFPLYYLVLVFGFLYYRFILPHFGYEFVSDYPLWKGILLSVTFFSNIFAKYSPGGILEILWSIGIEEQFYLLIAPLLAFVRLKNIKIFFAVFTVIYLLLFNSEGLKFLSHYNMMFFFFSFSGLCAILLENSLFRKIISWIKIPLLLLLLVYFFSSVFITTSDFLYYVLSMVLFGFSICALSLEPIVFFENKVLNYLGKISYGIYMYHAIVMQAVGLVMMKLFIKTNLSEPVFIMLSYTATLLITILVSHFSYQYYEKFFLKFKSNYRRNR